MKFSALGLAGAWALTPQRHEDPRGHFARTFCREEFAQHGLATELAQMSTSFNHHACTLRGMHYQAAPWAEAKLVRVTRGAVHDVLLDLRADSPSFMRWQGVHLSAENGCAVYIPQGVAHGFLTLVECTEVLYAMDTPHHADCARGVRWNDPRFAIEWPLDGHQPVLSERDASYADWTDSNGTAP